MRKLAALAALFVAGIAAAVALAATTGTVTACATVTSKLHTVAVDGANVKTTAGDVASKCTTTTYTVPTETTTQTVTNTVTQTVTVTTTQTTTPPPPPPACTSTVSPGADLNAAYQAAAPGDTICLTNGDFGAQVIGDNAAKDAASLPVTFAPAPGAIPLVSRLQFGLAPLGIRGPHHILVRDINVGYIAAWDNAEDIEWRNLFGRNFDIVSDGTTPYPKNIRVVGGSYGPCEAVAQAGECTARLIGDSIVVDGVHIHHVTSNDLNTYHVDGAFIRGCTNCTIKNSVFDHNMITNIRIQNCCSLPANSNINLQNDWFSSPLEGDGVTKRGDGVDVDTATPGLSLIGNTFEPRSGVVLNGTATLATNKMMYASACGASTWSNDTVEAFSEFTFNALCGTDQWADPNDHVNGTWPFNPPQ